LETNFGAKVALLRAPGGKGDVRELAKELRMGPAMVIRLRTDMVDEGLVEVFTAPSSRKGRPGGRIMPTPLGQEYLRAYDLLRSIGLRGRKADLLKAASDGRYAGRLASRGVSPLELFFALNSFAERPRKAAR